MCLRVLGSTFAGKVLVSCFRKPRNVRKHLPSNPLRGNFKTLMCCTTRHKLCFCCGWDALVGRFAHGKEQVISPKRLVSYFWKPRTSRFNDLRVRGNLKTSTWHFLPLWKGLKIVAWFDLLRLLYLLNLLLFRSQFIGVCI